MTHRSRVREILRAFVRDHRLERREHKLIGCKEADVPTQAIKNPQRGA